MKFKATTSIITVTLIVGITFGIYVGNNGIEDLSLVGEAEAAGGTVTGPNDVAPDRYVYYPGTEALLVVTTCKSAYSREAIDRIELIDQLQTVLIRS